MSRAVLLVQSEIFTWARDRRGFDLETAARRIGITPEHLKSLEDGEAMPTPSQVRSAAEAYLLSPAVFFLPKVPTEGFEPPRDFRVIGSEQRPGFSPNLRKEIERVRAQRVVMIELADLGVATSGSIDLSIDRKMSIEHNAQRIRSWLGLESTLTMRPASKAKLLASRIESIERRGILVAQVSRIPVSEMRGFCLADRPFPVIVLNGADSSTARHFTLFHELIHVLLGEDSVCNDPSSDDGEESVCNAIAAAILVPGDELLNHALVSGAVGSKRWSLSELETIGAAFGTSQEVILRRLLSLGKTTAEYYRIIRAQLLKIYRSLSSSEQSGGPEYHILLLRNLGSTYVQSVIAARNRGAISDSTVSDYIFAKIKHAGSMADQLGVPFE